MSNPAPVQRTFEQGLAQHRSGQIAAAERLYRQVLERDARHEQAAFLLAAIAIDSDRSPEAIELLQRLVATQPGNALYFTNLGEAQRRLGRYEQAASALVRAVTLNPELVQAHYNLGLVTRQLGELPSAIQAFERAAELKPESAKIQHALARVLLDSGEHARAIGHFQCALTHDPRSPEVFTHYAIALRKLKRNDSSLRAIERALELAPGSALAHHERSATLVELGRFDDAILSSGRALELQPDFAAAHAGLASALTFSGRLEEGLAAYRRAVELDPQDDLVHGNLIFLMAFDVGASAQTILEEARRWAERHAKPSAAPRAYENRADPERKLRIGYVSSNFNDHCQALFTLPLLTRHDRSRFELHAFSSTLRLDSTSESLRSHFDRWSDISQLSALAAAELIRAHGIDVLIDLTMHMSISKLSVFAHKPAPVQIAWLAYPGTTGLPAMDYRITDRYLDPAELPPEPYSEQPLVLPDSFWCYDPGATEPAVGALPAHANGHITFGCLNSFWKLNEPTLRLWAEVLKRVAGSRLLLLAPEGSARARVLEIFKAASVESGRIEFVARRPRDEYLKYYQRIDVCLDALPYNGHTTSLDSFWMGVPVVTLVGKTIVGRAGLCQALNLKLPELIAQTPEQFVAAAARISEDLSALAELRAGLRARMERSPLMDAERFAGNLEACYRDAWRRWCERAPH